LLPAKAPVAWASGAFPSRDSRPTRSPFRSALCPLLTFRLPVGGSPSLSVRFGLVRPLLTSRSTPHRRVALSGTGETSPGKVGDVPRTAAGFTPRTSSALWSQELRGQLPAHPGWGASYPSRAACLLESALPVRRLTVSATASFSAGLTTEPGQPRLLRLAVRSGSLRPASPGIFTRSPPPCWAHNSKPSRLTTERASSFQSCGGAI
jgi:hypothetical protein